MKRIVSAMLALIFVLSLAACGAQPAPKPKLFLCEEMRLTLNTDFVSSEKEGYSAMYHSEKSDVLVLREDKEYFKENLTFDEYVELVRGNNEGSDLGELIDDSGLSYFEYTYEDEAYSGTYECLTAVIESDMAYWLMQFYCTAEDYPEMKASFLEWAHSVFFKEKEF